ncbi:5'-nucleotidase C-terminal domain-containing protein [Priestia endophytica]|uniref:5'-nucleotidase C-terminal domain-containing protein n=1 Tax=Priestia endophytica TaxID=135735 RepID=UPI00124D9ED8|nr:5'-nucleotidase C-terminal domain-containing protein [Priestia endophytica]KAB2489379.1 2,' 3'-cyclic nucleotide 2'-phosphodiesterase [Priestia endophytica]
MKLKKFRKLGTYSLLSALAVSTYLIPFSSTYVKAETENIKVQLLSINDLHGQIDYSSKADVNGDGKKEEIVGGAEYLSAHMKEHEADNENTFYVHVGDIIGGSPLVSGAFQDEPVVEIMEEMGFDVGTVGNHEFDEGIEELRRMVKGGDHPEGKGTKGYDGMNFPVVAANAYDKSDGKLILPPYAVKEVDGAKIGFIGVVTTETPGMVIKKGNENLQITDEVKAINKYAKELKEQGVKSIVVLAHNPSIQEANGAVSGQTAEFAKKIDDEVDIIFAGHNHQFTNGVVDNKLIVQSFEYGQAFGDVDIEIDPSTGDIVKKSATTEWVTQEGIKPDEKVKSILEKYNEKVKPVKEEVISKSAVDYPSQRYPGFGPVGDHPVGNMIADGMRETMDADIALMNGGGVRAGIDKGDITFGELYTIQPFGNVLNKFTVTGAGLREILDGQITSYGLDYSISGLRYTYTYDHNAKRGKVVDIFLPNGKKINPSEKYTVVVNNYMFGADQAIIDNALDQPETGPVDIDATSNYVRSLESPVHFKAEGRIQEVSSIFKDVPLNSWSNPYVSYLANEGVVKGKSPEVFAPFSPLYRAQFASMLVRALDLKAEGTSPFKDLDKMDKETKDEITAAYKAGLIKGTSDTTFEPWEPISRSQMVTMMMRAYEVKHGAPYEGETSTKFTDLKTLDSEMKKAVAAAEELGYIEGYGDKFKPYNGATREQMAKVVSLFLLDK